MKFTSFFNIWLLATFSCIVGVAQKPLTSLQEFLANEKNIKSLSLKNPSQVLRFYQNNQYKLVWQSPSDQNIFFNELDNCGDLGLNTKDYQYNFIASLKRSTVGVLEDSVLADLIITDAALHFYKEVKIGNVAPILRYNGLNYQPESDDIPSKLSEYLIHSKLKQLALDLQPASKEYYNIQNILRHFNEVMSSADFKEVLITSSKVDTNNFLLKTKLYQLGTIDTFPTHIDAKNLLQKLQSAQKLLNLLNDGILRSTTLKALNVPLRHRREELVLAINYLRWLNEIKTQDRLVLINIPSATLLSYINGEMVLDSRIIAGKPSTPTPTLSSAITEVILYPYWNVPNNIATKELLPSIKKNIRYLESNNFQVLSKQRKVLDPYKINWNALSVRYFPYLIRQSTGCDNSLGIIKLNFYNPFTVYLHDTPGKGLFYLNKRYFSHGCMRLEKAIELGKLVANTHAFTIENIDEQGCLKSQSPIILPADEPMKIIVLYSTVWYDRLGGISFNDDPYQKVR